MRLLAYILIIFIFIVSASSKILAQDNYIAIKHLASNAVDNRLIIQCEINYQLDEKVKEALNNGIAMTFRLEVELMQEHRYWLDNMQAQITREFTVKYHALSKQFVMKMTGSDIEHSFPDLFSSFYFQRYLHNAVLDGYGSLDNSQNYYLRARARLVTEQLPLPLRIKSYLYPSWRPSSGWSIWPL